MLGLACYSDRVLLKTVHLPCPAMSSDPIRSFLLIRSLLALSLSECNGKEETNLFHNVDTRQLPYQANKKAPSKYFKKMDKKTTNLKLLCM